MTAVSRILDPKRAAHEADVTPKTIREWCRRYGIGRKIAGRYWVDFDRLEEFLKGGER